MSLTHRRGDEPYREVVENSPTVAWVTDASGATSFISPNVEKVYGYTPEEIEQGGEALWFGRIHAEDRPLVRRAFELLFREGGSFDVQYRIQRKDGQWIWLHDRANAVAQEAGQLRAYGVFTDITERKRIETERREIEARLRQFQKLESLGVLASGLAHDFNNLLVGIFGNMDLALHALAPADPVRRHVAAARAAAERAGELIEQMLTYAGKGKSRTEEVDLNQLVREMADLLSAPVSKKTTVHFDLCEGPLTIRGDPTQIRQIVMNLITNAGQAIGEQPGDITLETERCECKRALLREIRPDEELPEGEYARLRVTDTGPGMDAETRERIFDPFFTTKTSGSGLGLSAVHGIVRGHRGAIKVDSEPGRGSAFTLWLPATTRAAASSPERPLSEWRGHGTVLIVDDDAAVRSFATVSVEHLGFRALTASDGAEAVEVFRRRLGEIDCVLLDLRMPRMDGEEAFDQLRELSEDIPVLLSSGFAEEDLIARLVARGATQFLPKPYSLADLQAKLEALLGGR